VSVPRKQPGMPGTQPDAPRYARKLATLSVNVGRIKMKLKLQMTEARSRSIADE